MQSDTIPATPDGGILAPMEPSPAPDADLAALQQAGEARDACLGTLFEKHRARLLRMIQLRMDPGLKARVGASDVLQEAWLEVADRLPAYLEDPRMPFFVWLRFITAQRLMKLYRFHAGAKKRDLKREARILPKAGPGATSVALVDHLVKTGLTPSVVMAQGEFQALLVSTLEDMDPLDREVLVLRHFEELSNAEVAEVLELAPNTASKRYVRALERLSGALAKAGIEGP